MKELIEYREKLIARLEQAAQEFCDVCKASNPSTKIESDWSLHQVAAHTRDVDKFVYGVRVRKTLSEENPLLESFDADHWAETDYKKDEPLENILDEFGGSIKNLCGILRDAPQEAWSRVSRHETLGGELTMQLWVERSLAHIEEHLATVRSGQN